MNGYNFTERVRKTLAMARDEAARLHHEYVGTEHILLGLIREGGGVAAQVLQTLGADTARMRQQIDETVNKGKAETTTGPDLPYTSRAKKTLELAMAEARELNHSYVGTEHLLLGLLREERGIAAQILTANGATLPAVRAETVRLLGDATRPPELGIRRAAVAGAGPHAHPITGAEYDAALATPRNALAQFYAAFNTCDLALMATNWSAAPDVVMDNPLGGITRGWESIRAVYERIFEGPARVAVEFHDFTLHVTGDFFYAVGRERGLLERDGKELALAIRTTRVFRREGLGWRQVHHHGSMDDPAMLEAYQKLVRGA